MKGYNLLERLAAGKFSFKDDWHETLADFGMGKREIFISDTQWEYYVRNVRKNQILFYLDEVLTVFCISVYSFLAECNYVPPYKLTLWNACTVLSSSTTCFLAGDYFKEKKHYQRIFYGSFQNVMHIQKIENKK